MNNWMAPLWLMYPHISRFSIGWEVGYGRAYKQRFDFWFQSLTEIEQLQYHRKFPMPVFWMEERGVTRFYKPYYGDRLRRQLNKEDTNNNYIFFWEYQEEVGEVSASCLHQMYLATFTIDTKEYLCVEQYMMFKKAELFDDKERQKQVMEMVGIEEIQHNTNEVQGFKQEIWDQYKYRFALVGIYHKFIQNPILLTWLLRTEEHILVYANPDDTLWGIGMQSNQHHVLCPSDWQGENVLGLAVMEIRAELKRVCANIGVLDMRNMYKQTISQ